MFRKKLAVAVAAAALLLPVVAVTPAFASGVSITNDGNGFFTISDGGCQEQVLVTYVALDSKGYQSMTVEIYSEPLCGTTWPTEAGATCNNGDGMTGENTNFWGKAVTEDGGISYAGCDASYSALFNGGFRIEIGSTWYYDTFIYPNDIG